MFPRVKIFAVRAIVSEHRSRRGNDSASTSGFGLANMRTAREKRAGQKSSAPFQWRVRDAGKDSSRSITRWRAGVILGSLLAIPPADLRAAILPTSPSPQNGSIQFLSNPTLR